MTTAIHKRTIGDAILWEPLELAISQPPQMLISAASVFLVAAEAGILIDWPWNIALAVGAEWAYLRGLCSGQAARTRWAAGLIWSAVILVIAYGSLWGLRRFALIPDAPAAWVAVLLTALHIGCISAVTLCSAMCHRAELIARRTEEERTATDERARKAADDAHQQSIKHQREELNLEMERRWKEIKLAEEARALRISERNARILPTGLPKTYKAACCGASLSQPEAAAMNRWHTCKACGSKTATATKQ